MADPDYKEGSTEARRLCRVCVGDGYLKNLIEKEGAETECSYCDGIERTLPILKIAELVKAALERHYTYTENETSSYEYAMSRESGRRWEQSGEPLTYIIAEMAELTLPPAEDIQRTLKGNFSRPFEDGEDPFGHDAYYTEMGVNSAAHVAEWNGFELSLRTRNRFFGIEAILSRVFAGVTDHMQADGTSVVVGLGAGLDLEVIFRARVFQSENQLNEALRTPEIGLGPPPSTHTRDGRMNARGVSVFYGANTSTAAIAEVRPPIGASVLVGQFTPLRPFKLLDVVALRTILVKGSVFDPEFIHRLEHGKFLDTLSRRISKPVVPDDEPWDYLVTQAIADYLASSNHSLDGILYPSVCGGDESQNIVLFQKNSRVKPVPLPKGTKVDVSTEVSTEPGREAEYQVTEAVPHVKGVPKNGPSPYVFLRDPRPPILTVDSNDSRLPALILDRKSIHVHKVLGVQINTDPYLVNIRCIEFDESEQAPF